MATEPKRYAQRGTKVGEKTKLRNLPTALRDEPSYGRSLSFRNDSSLKTSTGGSGGSNIIPRSRVDMASGDRNIGSQKPTAGPKNIVPRGTSQPGPVKPEIPSSARTMKDVQGTDRAKALSAPRPTDKPEYYDPKQYASKASRVSNLSRAGLGLGAALYSKNAGEGSDFKGKDRPAPYSGLKLTGYDIPKDFGMKNPSEDWEDKKSDTPKTPEPKAPVAKAPTTKTGSSKTGASKGESQSSKDSRMAAYEKWVKTNRDPSTADYLKTGFGNKTPAADSGAQSRIDDNASFFKARQLASDNPGMKKGGKVKTKCYAKGGSVKSSASSRGDGCATKGHTKGAMR